MKRTIRIPLLLLLLNTALGGAWAQKTAPAPKATTLDLAAMYTTERSNYSYGSNIWLQGGAAEAALPVKWHLGAVANLTGEHTGGKNGGSPFSEVAFTVGPRYTWALVHAYLHTQTRLFGEALFGGVHGFDAPFPTSAGPASSFNAFAMQIGAGFDVDLGRHFAVRPLDLHYVQTHLPNGGTNRQNDLRLGFGVVYHLSIHE